MSAKLTFLRLKDLQSRIPSIEETRPVCYWLSVLSSPGSQGGQVLLLQFQGPEAVTRGSIHPVRPAGKAG